MKLKRRKRTYPVPVFHTSWGKLPLKYLLKSGFQFRTYAEAGYDVFTKRIGEYTIRVEDDGNNPRLSINGTDLVRFRHCPSRRQFINTIRSALANPANMLMKFKYTLVTTKYGNFLLDSSRTYFNKSKPKVHKLPYVFFDKSKALDETCYSSCDFEKVISMFLKNPSAFLNKSSLTDSLLRFITKYKSYKPLKS